MAHLAFRSLAFVDGVEKGKRCPNIKATFRNITEESFPNEGSTARGLVK